MATLNTSVQQVAESNFDKELSSLKQENEALRNTITAMNTSTQQVTEPQDIQVSKDFVSIKNYKPAHLNLTKLTICLVFLLIKEKIIRWH